MDTQKNTRQALLAVPKKFSETEFEIEGQKVLLRKPSIKERNELQQMAVKDDDGKMSFDALAFRIQAIISLCIGVADRKPIFSRSDYDTLLSYPTGSWVDKISEKIDEVLYVDTEAVKKD